MTAQRLRAEATTNAGRTFLDALRAMDAIDPTLPPVDWEHGIVAIEAEAREPLARALAESEKRVDGLGQLLSTILRKYGGTMKGRGDHDIFDALVRYRAALLEGEPKP